MTFREYIKLSEQGTGPSITGLGAAGRLGQSQVTPEGPQGQMPTPNVKVGPAKTQASPFNVSDKGKTFNRPPSNMSPGVKPLSIPPISPFTFSLKQPPPTQIFKPFKK
jgi:hypothetical protein